MIIYNTTYHIDKTVLNEALDYLKQIYIPKAMASGFLHTPSFSHILSNMEEGENGFALQFHVKNQETLQFWYEHEGKELHQAITERFGNSVLGFTTLLEEIDWTQQTK